MADFKRVDDNEYVVIENMCAHSVVYISYDHQRRAFAPGQPMTVPAKELRQLYFSRGGRVLLQNYLRVKNRSLAKELGVSDDSWENEYQWEISDIDKLLTSGSLDELLDALDFAPEGIIEGIVDRAVALKIADNNKREAIYKATGRNISKMISNMEYLAPANNVQEKKERRVSKGQDDAPKQTRRRVRKTSLAEDYAAEENNPTEE